MNIDVRQDIYERLVDYCATYGVECIEFVNSTLDSLLPIPTYIIKQGNNFYNGSGFVQDGMKAVSYDKTKAFELAKKLKGTVAKLYKDSRFND